MIPPTMVRLKIREKSSKGLSLWLPLILLWPLFLLLGLFLFPFVLVISVLRLGPLRGLKAMALFYELLCSLRGTEVDIQGADGSAVRVWIR